MQSAPPARFSVGLTGGIGCGKTTVADMFAELGAALVDTDLIAHALTAPGGAAMADIVTQFGPGYADPSGALERRAMRELVFADAGARQRLEAILHPRIRDEALAQAAASRAPYVIFVVPLLIESGTWRARVTRVLAIDCPEEMQVARVMARNNLSEEQVRAIMATQISRADRLAAADDVVRNDSGREQLRPQIALLHEKYLAFSDRLSRLPSERL
ncbi:dephospho-CoA kinase [Massilia sp. CF038]|uniref:dephospho-CoA kinase n=1 Tax=Massilia sp. CF038 TaxID=1881045 RepID=UPI00091391D3|nr:dephospho-CoA kinase [Massilia sp. CF038]SHH24412.1 dephospho-CoA kinase [Massilia sp. CF038]